MGSVEQIARLTRPHMNVKMHQNLKYPRLKTPDHQAIQLTQYY